MIFHAADDTTVNIQQSREFVQRAKSASKDVQLVEVATGDHYESMINEGIPAGIKWIKGRLK
jgi:dipeptidyl aminopeptidase/acylaminoacyl peptidase